MYIYICICICIYVYAYDVYMMHNGLCDYKAWNGISTIIAC